MKHQIITLILLLLPYLVWADSQAFKLNNKPVPEVVARVNGTTLKSAQLQSEFISLRLRFQAQGKTIPPSEETLIARELLKAEIMKELIAEKARSLNIKITPEKINLEIQNIEDKFPSHSAFVMALAIQRMDIKALKKKIERTLLEDELIRLEIAPKVKLRDGAAKEFYNTNKEKFSKPVLYSVRHIMISTIHAPKKLEDEADHKKALRIAKVINDEAKSKAEEVLQKIKGGEDFIELAKEFSEDEASKKDGGMLGHLHPDSSLPAIATEMVKLNEGETSNIIQSPLGYHIIKLNEIIPSILTSFEESESDILNILMKRETQRLFKNYLIELEINAKIDIFI